MRALAILAVLAGALGCGSKSYSQSVPGYPGGCPSFGYEEVIGLINKERSARGINAIGINTPLMCSARLLSANLFQSKRCSHTDTLGQSPWQRAQICGGNANGEIIACGQRTAREAVDAWLRSPGHARIMLDPAMTSAGSWREGNYYVVVFKR